MLKSGLAKRKIISLIFNVPLLIISATLINNFIKYPISKGFDASAHVEYIEFLKTNKYVPLANQGWEFYQPPLYYVLASLLSTPNQYKLIGFIALTALIMALYHLTRRYGHKVAILTTALCISIPVLVYLSPTVSNEFLSGVLISIALIYYVTKKPFIHRSRHQIILGVLIGLSLLAKATAWVLVAAVVIDLLLDLLNSPKKLIRFWLLTIVMLAIGGWFYTRNITIFGNPFVSSVDFAHFQFWQPPGFRDFRFFTTLEGILKLDLFTSHWYSLISGTYFSWFYDAHSVLLPIQSPPITGKIIVLISLPLFILVIIEMYQNLKTLRSKTKIFTIYPLLLWLAYIVYNLKLPFYSTVKGSFLISLIVPFAYYAAKIYYRHRKSFFILFLYTCLYTTLISYHFWIK